MDNVSITEKYTLCILKEKKSLYLQNTKPYVIVSMIIEMMLDENLEITDKNKVMLKDKIPTATYNKKLYDVIKGMRKDKIPLRNIISAICFGLSFKNLKDIIGALTDSMSNHKLISKESKKGLLGGNKDVIKIEEDKFKDIIGEIRTEFLEDGNLTEDSILLASLLSTNRVLKNIFSKYEKEEISNKLKDIKNTEISEKVKVAQSVINMENVYLATVVASGASSSV